MNIKEEAYNKFVGRCWYGYDKYNNWYYKVDKDNNGTLVGAEWHTDSEPIKDADGKEVKGNEKFTYDDQWVESLNTFKELAKLRNLKPISEERFYRDRANKWLEISKVRTEKNREYAEMMDKVILKRGYDKEKNEIPAQVEQPITLDNMVQDYFKHKNQFDKMIQRN